MDHLAFILRVLELTQESEDLTWLVKDGRARFFVSCNDLFFWACADGEEITPDNVELFAQAIADCRSIERSLEEWGGNLFACRVRKMRPQRPAYPQNETNDPDIAKLIALFDACGPERTRESEG